jgi:hypothetical protein
MGGGNDMAGRNEGWQVEMRWPDIHWLAWAKGGLVAAVLRLA